MAECISHFIQWFKNEWGLLWWSVVKNQPANAGDMDSIPGSGRSYMPQSNWAQVLQLLKPMCQRACAPQQRSHCNEKPVQLESGPCSQQLEKSSHGNRDPAQPTNKYIKPKYWMTLLYVPSSALEGFPGGSVVKSMPADAGEAGSISRSRRSPGEGNGNPLQYSYLENPVDRGAWWATIHGVAKSWTWLSDFCVCVVVVSFCYLLVFISLVMWSRKPVCFPGLGSDLGKPMPGHQGASQWSKPSLSWWSQPSPIGRKHLRILV